MNSMWGILELSMCAFEIILYSIFCYRILGFKEDIKWPVFLSAEFISILIIFIITAIRPYSATKSILGAMICLFLILIFFDGTYKNKIFLFTLIYTLMGLTDISATWCISLIGDKSLADVINLESVDRLISYCIGKILYIVAYTAIDPFKIIFKTEKRNIIPKEPWLVFLCLFSVLLIAALILADLGFRLENAQYFNKLLTIMITILFMIYFAVYFSFYYICQYFIKISELNMIAYQNEVMEKYILQKEGAAKKLFELEHNLKHQLTYWNRLAKDNNSNLTALLSEFEEEMRKTKLLELGNEAANAIINEKWFIANANNIHFKVRGRFENGIMISDLDLCSLLGNILDNALEAVMKIEDSEKRHINMSIKRDGRFLYLEVENSYEKEPVIINNNFITNKINRLNHGIGILSVKNIAEKYQGATECTFKGKIFNIFIMLEAYKIKQDLNSFEI